MTAAVVSLYLRTRVLHNQRLVDVQGAGPTTAVYLLCRLPTAPCSVALPREVTNLRRGHVWYPPRGLFTKVWPFRKLPVPLSFWYARPRAQTCVVRNSEIIYGSRDKPHLHPCFNRGLLLQVWFIRTGNVMCLRPLCWWWDRCGATTNTGAGEVRGGEVCRRILSCSVGAPPGVAGWRGVVWRSTGWVGPSVTAG